MRGVAGKEAYTVRAYKHFPSGNILQLAVAGMFLTQYTSVFSFSQASDAGEVHGFVPTTVPCTFTWKVTSVETLGQQSRLEEFR